MVKYVQIRDIIDRKWRAMARDTEKIKEKEKKNILERIRRAKKKWLLVGLMALLPTGTGIVNAQKEKGAKDNTDNLEILKKENVISLESIKQTVIDIHVAGTIQASYQAYRDVVDGGFRVVKKKYPDTNMKTLGKYLYCLRSHTKAVQEYKEEKNIAYLDHFFEQLANPAYCWRFQYDITNAFPDDLYGKINKKNEYEKIILKPENIKVGDFVIVRGSGVQGDVTGGTEDHALRAVGHEYDKEGNMTSAILISLNGESFRRLGAEGEFSTVDIPNYRNEKFYIMDNNVKGVSIHFSDIMKKCLDMEIAQYIDTSMNPIEVDKATRELLAKYCSERDVISRGDHIASLYNKTGKDIVNGLGKLTATPEVFEKYYAESSTVKEKPSNKLTAAKIKYIKDRRANG